MKKLAIGDPVWFLNPPELKLSAVVAETDYGHDENEVLLTLTDGSKLICLRSEIRARVVKNNRSSVESTKTGGRHMKKKLEVVQQEGMEVSAKVLATSIENIADATTVLLNAGLNRRAIMVLLKDSSGVSLSDIEKVLNALRDLKKDYCK